MSGVHQIWILRGTGQSADPASVHSTLTVENFMDSRIQSCSAFAQHVCATWLKKLVGAEREMENVVVAKGARLIRRA